MAITRLVGTDGKLAKVAFGANLTGDDASDLDTLVGGGVGSGEGYYKIINIATGGAGTSLPANIAVGDLWWDDGTTVLGAGGGAGQEDIVSKLTDTDLCDLTSFSLELTKGEIETTTICDAVKKYRGGRTDASGTMEGIYTIGTTDIDGGLLNNFLEIVRQSSAGLITKDAIDTSTWWVKGILQADDQTSAETLVFVYMEIQILSASLGAGGEDAQTFSGNFRITGTSDPQLYTRVIA